MKKPILYLDMDMVLVNFNGSDMIPLEEKHIHDHPSIYKEGFFRNLPPMVGAIAFVESILKWDYYDVQVLTQPVSGSFYSYSEKAEWVAKYIPALKDKINMTQNKENFIGYMLIDDNPKWSEFQGELYLFNPKIAELEWAKIKDILITKILNHE